MIIDGEPSSGMPSLEADVWTHDLQNFQSAFFDFALTMTLTTDMLTSKSDQVIFLI